MAFAIGLEARTQVVQDVPPLLPACRHHRQHPLHEPAALRAIRSTADPTPDHRVPLGTLRGIVRRWHTPDPREGPQALLDAQDLSTGSPGPRALAAHPVLQG